MADLSEAEFLLLYVWADVGEIPLPDKRKTSLEISVMEV